MAKGNVAIDTSFVKEMKNGKIIQTPPDIPVNGRMYPSFTPISPVYCSACGRPLKPNGTYDRLIISSYGTIRCLVTYWVCPDPRCGKHHADTIAGVTGSANYSDEYIEKENAVRYNGRCSLWSSRIVGETFTAGLNGVSGRAPCPTTLWSYEQKRGRISAQELSNQEIDFNGTLYIDGYWVKSGWRTYIESQLGRKLTKKEWKRIRYQIIYVVATEDKVVLDFQITGYMPGYLELVPLMNRIKSRIPEGEIVKIVSDEDRAIIRAVKSVFLNVAHSFCVFHQLKNVTQKYLDEFQSIEKIPHHDFELYELAKSLILAETSIDSTIVYQRILKLASDMESVLSQVSKKLISYLKDLYFKNRELLEAGFVPETNNVMEQLFSLINDIFEQARSFKTTEGLSNFCYNLFTSMNNRCFNTGKWRGFSPLSRAKIKFG
jgi:hypothetical protein